MPRRQRIPPLRPGIRRAPKLGTRRAIDLGLAYLRKSAAAGPRGPVVRPPDRTATLGWAFG
jgi:hypothetical protein